MAIFKPRCGSKSVRQMIDPFLEPSFGDIAVNMAGEVPSFHPHIPAPYLQEILRTQGHDEPLEFFITIPHTIEMFKSYCQFFQPEQSSRYNYSPGRAGRVGREIVSRHVKASITVDESNLGTKAFDKISSMFSFESCACSI